MPKTLDTGEMHVSSTGQKSMGIVNGKRALAIWGSLALLLAALIINGGTFDVSPELTDGVASRWAAIAVGLLAVGYAVFLIVILLRQDPGTEQMQRLARHIESGAQAFLAREYRVLLLFTAAVALPLSLLFEPRPWVGVSYVLGTFVSAGAAWIGMSIAVRANVRTANAARDTWASALQIAFSGGAVMGFSVVGLALITLTSLTLVLPHSYVWLGFVFGSTVVALFLRVGGGIYTKSADVGADLVGKVEASIPEDDARNPAVIADNVGDNVGDIAGMGSDLYESYVSALVAAMVLGNITLGFAGVVIPLLLGAMGVLASLIGVLLVQPPHQEGDSFEWQVRKAHVTMNRGVYVSTGVMILGSYLLLVRLLGNDGLALFWCLLSGLATGFLIGPITEWFTSEHRPVIGIARISGSGPAVGIMEGLAAGMLSTVGPILIIAIAVLVAHHFAGLLGIAIASVGMVANLAMLLSMDCYGPITDNAAGIAQMAGLGAHVRERCESLDTVGNSTAAFGKGFAISSGALAAMAWLATYYETAGIAVASITDPQVMAGLFIGAMLVYLFSALTMRGVSRGAFAIVKEVRRQFDEVPGVLTGETEPDYVTCVTLATAHSLRAMLLPGILTCAIPVAVGLVLTAETVAGLLLGALLVGLPLAIMMANAGGAWDNAKKYIEAGHFGGKGSSTHEASVIGDTVGDPFKDTIGPSLNILIKLVGKMAVIFSPLFALWSWPG